MNTFGDGVILITRIPITVTALANLKWPDRLKLHGKRPNTETGVATMWKAFIEACNF